MAAAVCKRSAAIFDAGHASSTEQGSETGCSKRMRIGSTEAYETTDILGAGSFGIVKKARHCATGKTVAIKFLRPTTDASELPQEARFLEACAGNPYVVRSHGFVRDPATTKLCLAMEYVGPNLEAFLSERPPLPEAVVCAYMWQLLNGAKEMHEGHIVHRDIKLSNILVGEGGKILKFCDLGLAMSLATEKTPYGDAGTVPYMAPEMLLGKPDYDAKVDAWSLGCVMAEMLSGKRLFDSKGARRGDKIDQLRTIFGVLGLPDDRTWPEFASLPLAHAVRRSFQARENSTLGELFHADMLSEDGFTVLKGLLECNPDKRLTAAAALQLPWLLPEIDRFATPQKKDAMWIKNTPPVALERINLIIPRPALKNKKKKNARQINFVPPEPPKHKNVLRVPLAMWKSAQLMDPCKC